MNERANATKERLDEAFMWQQQLNENEPHKLKTAMEFILPLNSNY